MKTGSITYNGKNSLELGVYTTGSGSFDAAELDVDKYEIPGRNGDLILSNNRYKNIEIIYPAFIPKAFMDKVQNVRNWLRSSRVYARLEDTYDPDHYRLGIPTGVQSFEPANRNDGANFEITFDCKPQRFLKAGETPETVEADVQTESGEIVTFETIAESPMTSAEVSLSPQQDLNGYDSPWPGGGGKNLLDADGMTAGILNTSGQVDTQNVTVNSKGNGAVAWTSTGTWRGVTTDFIAVQGGNTYRISLTETVSYVLYAWYDQSKGFISRSSFNGSSMQSVTAPNNAYYVRFTFQESAAGTYSYTKMQLENGNTATAYAPYSNICPISGHTGAELYRTGKNLFGYSLPIHKGYWSSTAYVGDNSVVTLENATGWTNIRVPVPDGATITIRGMQAQSGIYAAWLGSDNPTDVVSRFANWRINSTWTAPDGAKYLGICFNALNTDYANYPNAKINIGSTPETYEPYEGTTYSVTFTDQGTVYGGTYDWVSGKLRVEYGSYTFTGSESWTKGSYPWGYDTSITANGYSTTISGIKSSAKANIISDTFVLSSTTARNIRAAVEWSLVDCCINNVVGFDYIVIRYDSITDSATFAQYMAGKTIVYELETPLEYTLSAQQIETLLGENNVWSDAGPITLTYAEPFTIENPTLFDARPLFTVTNPAEGDVITVNGQTITFVDGYTGTVYIDCETMNAYSGAANLNSIIEATDFPVLAPGTNIVTWTGTGECTMTPRWWEL